MPIDPRIEKVTERIELRSRTTRQAYLDKIQRAVDLGPVRRHLTCGNQAHAYASMGRDKARLAESRTPHLGIVSAYNDMLSSHQPYERFPTLIKEAARKVGATAQVAGGVPAMCDGVTQGQPGMKLSLFSRDVIALSAAVALSHNTFDSVVFLGVCDKIVPGLVMAAATFGHLPAIFLPSGPMTSGLPNDEKSLIRQRFAAGEIDRHELMRAEMASYHGPGTCTFYGTANSNQMLMEFMGLQLPGASFVNPNTPLRDELTVAGVERALEITALGDSYLPFGKILSEKALVNGMVGLMATGGSTNLVMHLTAMARTAGLMIETSEFADVSNAVPLMARVYPNGLADVNQFHAAGGLPFLIGELIDAGLLHRDVPTVAGIGLGAYANEPILCNGELAWKTKVRESMNDRIVRPASSPFSKTGGLKKMTGNLGCGIMKVSAVKPEHFVVEAPVRTFDDQASVKAAFKRGELYRDVIAVVRFQGPKANGMPELHGLIPILSVLQDRGFKVALLTDGRMSGASGKVPAVIHMSPEAAESGPIAKLVDGDLVCIDANKGLAIVKEPDMEGRTPARPPANGNEGCGQEIFEIFRASVGSAETGAAVVA